MAVLWFIVTDVSFTNKSGARFRAELVNHTAGPDSFVCASRNAQPSSAAQGRSPLRYIM